MACGKSKLEELHSVMKIGVSAFAWTGAWNASHSDLLPAIKEIGFEGFEIPMFDPAALPAAEIRRAFEANALECTVCAILPAGINPVSPDAAVRRRSFEHLKLCIETTAELGSRLIGGPLFAPIGYLPGHRRTTDEWSWAVEAFKRLGEVLDAHRMMLSIEPVNRSESFFLRTAKEAEQLCESIDHGRIGITIDTFHANIEERSIPAAIRSLGHHLRHIHASENDRGPLGRGHVPFAEIISALKMIGYEGYLMIEGFGYDPKAENAPGHLWASIDVSPETLALESYRYLSQVLANSN